MIWKFAAGLFLKFLGFDLLVFELSRGNNICQFIGMVCLSVGGWLILFGLSDLDKKLSNIQFQNDLLFDQHWVEDESGIHRRDVYEGRDNKEG